MYAYFIGKVVEFTSEGIVLETNRMGINILCSETTKSALAGREGEQKIYTYTHVREDAISLFGFLSREELSLFKKMITVSGIGPKGALSILSALPLDVLIFAIISGDAKSIAKAPGIGAKTAGRLILELKDKVSASAVEESAEFVSSGGTDSSDSAPKNEAVEALVALGYSFQEAVRAVKDIKETDLSAEEYVKRALRVL